MQITFDPTYNIAYIQLKDKTTTVNTVRVNDDIMLDLAPDGSLYGIELLNASTQLLGEKHEKLKMLNELTGITTEIELPF